MKWFATVYSRGKGRNMPERQWNEPISELLEHCGAHACMHGVEIKWGERWTQSTKETHECWAVAFFSSDGDECLRSIIFACVCCCCCSLGSHQKGTSKQTIPRNMYEISNKVPRPCALPHGLMAISVPVCRVIRKIKGSNPGVSEGERNRSEIRGEDAVRREGHGKNETRSQPT